MMGTCPITLVIPPPGRPSSSQWTVTLSLALYVLELLRHYTAGNKTLTAHQAIRSDTIATEVPAPPLAH